VGAECRPQQRPLIRLAGRLIARRVGADARGAVLATRRLASGRALTSPEATRRRFAPRGA
jgi:hypothetical protein